MAQFIKIEWDASPSPISGYNVYRGGADGNESNVPLNTSPITDTFYDDYTIFPGKVYCYTVTAVLNGVESTNSLKIYTEPIGFINSPAQLDLGAFAGFGLLAATTITNVPGTGTTSDVTGDVGVFPGSSITGFESVRISGSYHLADYVAGYAQSSLTNTFLTGMALTGATSVPADLGGLVLIPGIYSAATSAAITGVLVLNAEGNPDAVWVFQIGSTLTTAAGNSTVVLVGGAQATNVTWLVGSSATMGVDTIFAGNVIAYASITVNTNASVCGRLGARTAAITLDKNAIIIYGSCYEPLPASPANTPPEPPSAPTGVHVDDLNADGLVNNIPILPIVTTSVISMLSETSANGGGNITHDGYDVIIARGVCWSTNINPLLTGSHTIDGSGVGVFTSLIANLLPFTTYYVRAYAVNSAGTAYGDNVMFIN
jgi:hypothetical protein